ncbi:MAG TPA: helix-turn-helix domain-containing protein [Thermomicrobiales bacterium]|nr:helix-turn-helix domain-containing protein [Thermomicrobiales bacterium]
MRANSLDLRQRIVEAVRAGHPKAEVASLFQVDRSTINRYLRLAAAGELAPQPIPGRPPRIACDEAADLVLQLRLHPTATLADHCEQWATVHGTRLSPATMSRAIKRVGWSRKKGQWQPANATRLSGLPGGPR